MCYSNSVEEETVAKEEHELFSITPNTALELTEQLKLKFRNIVHCKYNNDVWFQASAIASYLEYKDPKQSIRDHVDACNKISYEKLCSLDCGLKNPSGLHPDTILNEKGLLRLMHRSNMPLATGKKRGVEEVYVATTALYEEKGAYKIGKAECSTKRINNMNTGRTPDDEMYLSQCSNALKAEKLIHSVLNDYRIAPNREFFKHSLVEIKNVVHVSVVLSNGILVEIYRHKNQLKS